MNNLQSIFNLYGFTLKQAAEQGIPYQTVYKQLKGTRPIGAKSAMRYHKILGIPLYELRPDLWPPQLFGKDNSHESL